MKAIGFRAEPTALHWAVVEGPDQPLRLLGNGKLTAPKTYTEAESLGWYRNEVRTLIDEFHPQKAAIRYPEPSARQGKPTRTHIRVRMEGVVLEAIQSKSLPVLTGALTTMRAELETDSAKAYVDTGQFRGLDCSSLTENTREAVVVAAAALGSPDANPSND